MLLVIRILGIFVMSDFVEINGDMSSTDGVGVLSVFARGLLAIRHLHALNEKK